MGWLAQLDELPLVEVADALGLKHKGSRLAGHISPCPGCNKDQRGSDDTRGPIGFVRQKWKCHRCKVAGGPVRLAALSLLEEIPAKGSSRWAELPPLLAERGLDFGAGEYAGRRPAVSAPPAPPPRPPADEVRDFWGAALPVDVDEAAAGWLESRGLDPHLVADEDLARAIPAGAPCPAWARFRGTDWSRSGHRLIFRVADETGHTRSLRARSVLPDVRPGEKAAAAAAGPGSSGGLVFANSAARRIFGGEAGRLLIVEGGPDWLTWATAPAGLPAPDGEGWGVAGIYNGAWSSTLADAIPDGSLVVLRPHLEDKLGDGEKYADAIVRSLSLRPIRILRRRSPEPGLEPAAG